MNVNRGQVYFGNRMLCGIVAVVLGIVFTSCREKESPEVSQYIQPYSENPWYWQYEGEPVMLLGGNETDHTFLMPQMHSYLKELKETGGNYVRNVMSQREPDPENRPHQVLANGKYDLNQWNERYWDKFEELLKTCNQMDIIVSLELWDKFDYWHLNYWPINAWNPNNNINFTFEESGFLEAYNPVSNGPNVGRMGKDLSGTPFINTVPELANNEVLLPYQHAFMDKVLSYSFKYPNVVYNISNEWKEAPEWSAYWAKYVRTKASEAGVKIQVAEMVWSLSSDFDDKINFVIERSDLFSFCGFRAGQVFTPHGEGQYDRILEIRDRVNVDSAGPRPMSDVKIRTPRLGYGYSIHPQARVWRPLLAGWAGLSAHRVHNNSDDLGFTDAQKANLKALRTFSDSISPWDCEPHNDLLSDRSEDEAYLLANPGHAYGLYFVRTGSVGLDLRQVEGAFSLQWINIETGETHGSAERVEGGKRLEITTPVEGSVFGWAVTLTK